MRVMFTRVASMLLMAMTTVGCEDQRPSQVVQLTATEVTDRRATVVARNVGSERVTISACLTVTVWREGRWIVPVESACLTIGEPLLAGERRPFEVAMPDGREPVRVELAYSRAGTTPTATGTEFVRLIVRQ